VRLENIKRKPGQLDKIQRRAKMELEEFLRSQVAFHNYRYSLHALASLFSDKYFSRVWIAQEVILGKTNVFQIGDTMHSVAVVAAASQVLEYLTTISELTPHAEPLNIKHYEIANVRRYYFEAALHNRWIPSILRQQSHDYHIVASLSKKFCSDPRDYIYGVASLFRHPDPYEVDYTLSNAEVFADFTVHCLLRDHSTYVFNEHRLIMDHRYFRQGLGAKLPTWCPDWSMAGAVDPVGFDQRHDCVWKASGATSLILSRPSRITLGLKGVAVDKITLCNDSLLCWEHYGECDEDPSVPWLAHGDSLCVCFELQGLQIDQGLKKFVLDMFERILHPEEFYMDGYAGISQELSLLLDGTETEDLMALLAPVYLAKADPELFERVGFAIDAKIPRDDYVRIRDFMGRTICNRTKETRLFFTEGDMVGIGYPGVKEGDLVCIIYGSSVPQILRQADGKGRFFLVGGCNVDGLMFGEGLEMGLLEQEFILI
jgi:hypothetical protein